VLSTIGYHLRSAEHGLTGYDWLRFLDFADSHLGRSEPADCDVSRSNRSKGEAALCVTETN
jgi:hypothetical protein